MVDVGGQLICIFMNVTCADNISKWQVRRKALHLPQSNNIRCKVVCCSGDVSARQQLADVSVLFMWAGGVVVESL